MACANFQDLVRYMEHEIVISTYGDEEDPVSVCVECQTCWEVLFEFEKGEEN